MGKIKLLEVPAGEFLYGDEKEERYLPTFLIGETPVTNEQYKDTVPSHSFPEDKRGHPVVNISWNEAVAFCEKNGYRLPTEYEWEKAARGTDGRTYPWGEELPSLKRCNFNNHRSGTTPIWAFPRGVSPYGCYDMAGNVFEWCSSTYSSNCDDNHRMVRGGAFASNYEYCVRCAYRNHWPPDYHHHWLGFRVAKDVDDGYYSELDSVRSASVSDGNKEVVTAIVECRLTSTYRGDRLITKNFSQQWELSYEDLDKAFNAIGEAITEEIRCLERGTV